MRHSRRRVYVAPIAIDKAGHRYRAVAGAEMDAERAALVLELRLAIVVPDDNDPRAPAHRSRVGDEPAHAGSVALVMRCLFCPPGESSSGQVIGGERNDDHERRKKRDQAAAIST